jgi:predicted GNAT family acetyltransferase
MAAGETPPGGRLMVRDNPTASRFELVDGAEVIGIAEYQFTDPGVAVMPHTVIDASRRGQGLGDVLIESALKDLSARGLRIVPACWFVADYLQRHPDAATAA